MQNILGNITQLLKYEYQRQGYSLTEDEDFINLHFKGKQVATFSTHRTNLNAVNDHIELHKND